MKNKAFFTNKAILIAVEDLTRCMELIIENTDCHKMLNLRNPPTDKPLKTRQYREKLEKRDMNRVSEFISTQVGIQLPESKHTMVEGRLRKRLHTLGYVKFKDYIDHALDAAEYSSERLHLIDAITTNKTEFFREPEHFDYLLNEALPVLEKNCIRDNRKVIYLWSAGCSTGEEPYTLSMVMNEATDKISDLRFKILATDISHRCLRFASRGVYTEQHITPVPMKLRKKYLLRSKKPDEDLVSMGPEIRCNVRFEVLNLIDKKFSLKQKMDVIFCRNVMIYFNKSMSEELVNRFAFNLVQGGYLFVGHSESLNGINNCLKQVAPMVYQKQ